MVHQHFSLVPRMTVVENLMLGQARGVLNRQAFAARISDIADRFGFVARSRMPWSASCRWASASAPRS